MSYLLTGISYGGRAWPKDDSVRVVHHLEYDLEHKSILLVVDLLLVNQQPFDGVFWLVHRGDIEFCRVPGGELFEDNIQTSFLKEEYWPSLTGQMFSLDDELNAALPDGENIHMAHQKFLDTFKRIDDRRGGFSLYQMELPAESSGALRIKGRIEGENYRIMEALPEKLGIYGGPQLIKLLEKDMRSHTSSATGSSVGYRSHRLPLLDLPLLDLFADEFDFQPERYDIALWTKRGAVPISAERLSSDLFMGCEGRPYKGQILTWYVATSMYRRERGLGNTRVWVERKKPEPTIGEKVGNLISSMKRALVKSIS